MFSSGTDSFLLRLIALRLAAAACAVTGMSMGSLWAWLGLNSPIEDGEEGVPCSELGGDGDVGRATASPDMWRMGEEPRLVRQGWEVTGRERQVSVR